jgi:hypothetical protein
MTLQVCIAVTCVQTTSASVADGAASEAMTLRMCIAVTCVQTTSASVADGTASEAMTLRMCTAVTSCVFQNAYPPVAEGAAGEALRAVLQLKVEHRGSQRLQAAAQGHDVEL